MKHLAQQFKTIIDNNQKILLLTHQNMDGDGLSSMLIMKKYLESFKKDVTIISNEKIPLSYHFLPGIEEINSKTSSDNELVLSVECEDIEVDQIKYVVEDNLLNLIITPKKGKFHPETLVSKKTIHNYDLIIVFDAGDLEHLGSFYEENTDLFYSVPIINIDHHISNTGFGQLNIVDSVSASTTQIVYNMLAEISDLKDFLTEDLATLVLTGLIVDTGSFQHTNTSPKALELAANLIEKGARQQEIIQNVYKTKPLSTLKLWGRVLSKIEEDNVRKIVWSTITKEDLLETGALIEEADLIIDELMTNAPGAEIVILFKDSFDSVMSASLRSTNIATDVLPIAKHFNGGGHQKASGFKTKSSNFNKFVADSISFIEKYQEEKLGLNKEDIKEKEKEFFEKQKIYFKEKEQLREKQKKGRDVLSELVDEDVLEIKEEKKENKQNNSKNIEKTNLKKDNSEEKKDLKEDKKKEEVKKQIQNNKEIEKNKKQTDLNKKDKQSISKKTNLKENKKKEEPKKELDKKQSNANLNKKTENNNIKSSDQNKDNYKKEQNLQNEKRKNNFKNNQQKSQNQINYSKKPENNNNFQTNNQTRLQKQTNKNNQTESNQAQEKKVNNQNLESEKKSAQNSQNNQNQENSQKNQQVTKEQALQYANYYAKQLHQMDPRTQEYAKIYSYYQYYFNLSK